MNGDRVLLVVEIAAPRRAGHPSVPEMCDVVSVALKELYDLQSPRERALLNIRAYGLDFVHETVREIV